MAPRGNESARRSGSRVMALVSGSSSGSIRPTSDTVPICSVGAVVGAPKLPNQLPRLFGSRVMPTRPRPQRLSSSK
ncbi:MAG: hypothetical protein ACYTF3_12525, partial [Planctomycetota bacterium]